MRLTLLALSLSLPTFLFAAAPPPKAERAQTPSPAMTTPARVHVFAARFMTGSLTKRPPRGFAYRLK